jgi:hypothetical protein
VAHNCLPWQLWPTKENPASLLPIICVTGLAVHVRDLDLLEGEGDSLQLARVRLGLRARLALTNWSVELIIRDGSVGELDGLIHVLFPIRPDLLELERHRLQDFVVYQSPQELWSRRSGRTTAEWTQGKARIFMACLTAYSDRKIDP